MCSSDLAGAVLRRTLASAGLLDVDITVVDSLTAQKRLAEAGFGLALLPVSSVREEMQRGSLARVVVGKIAPTDPIAAVHRRGGFLSPAAETLLQLLETHLPAACSSVD